MLASFNAVLARCHSLQCDVQYNKQTKLATCNNYPAMQSEMEDAAVTLEALHSSPHSAPLGDALQSTIAFARRCMSFSLRAEAAQAEYLECRHVFSNPRCVRHLSPTGECVCVCVCVCLYMLLYASVPLLF